MRAVRDDAGPISFQHSFVRALVGFVEIYVFSGVPAFFSALLSSKGKRLGDYAAGTYVVRERVSLVLPPPADDAAAAGALGRRAPTSPPCPIGLAVAIRQFLGRVHADRAGRPPVARGAARRADQAVRRAGRRPPAPRPRRSSRRSSPRAATATTPGSCARTELRRRLTARP